MPLKMSSNVCSIVAILTWFAPVITAAAFLARNSCGRAIVQSSVILTQTRFALSFLHLSDNSHSSSVRWMRAHSSPLSLETAVNDTNIARDDDSSSNNIATVALDGIVSPVLKQVYPALLQHVKEYGHPNIPLGSVAGKQCKALRRLHTQQKLVESDVALLDELNFYWHSLEDVYELQKDEFDDLLARLEAYGRANHGNLSPPKKYAADPELGAWVTALRRLHTVPGAIDPSHVQRLNDLHFEWISPRQCGSKFMQMYRTIQERLAQSDDDDDNHVWEDPAVYNWVYAQQEQVHSLSETRKHYLAQLIRPDWTEWRAQTTEARSKDGT
jgi:Helicase associated domain